MSDKKDEIEDSGMDEQLDNTVSSTNNNEQSDLHKVIFAQTMYREWYLDYASYVILDRAFPDVYDGLKPVQRRILHSMDELEDGRYNKVANIVGNTMKYHPHGDQSIYGALVQLGQKKLLIDTQGNWGNILTGDPAAAPRYIEARLSKFALEVVFNHKTTEWQVSYDGRNKEPIALPIKFPLLLAQGVDGVGVGMSTKILPHNFNELIDASIKYLRGQDFEIYPDFPTGGTIDVSKYNNGAQGGKIRNRAKINIVDNKTLVITEIPFGTTTGKLISESKSSITNAVDSGKLKIKKIDDNTAANAEIYLHLQPGVSPDQTIDALYAFTDCEMTYYTNACVIWDGKPRFTNVKEILKINTENTLQLLKRELEIQLNELDQQWHKISLEKIFFEKRIYKELEKDTDTWDTQVSNIERAFDPYRKLFRQEITRENVLALCEKPVRKISKFDIKKAEQEIADIELYMDEVQNNLAHLVDYAVNYFRQLKKKYGADKQRLTEIKEFDNIVAATVAVANQKLYVNKKEGFVGTALKKDEGVEYACDCSDLDEIITFHEDGKFSVTKVADKHFVGKNILHVEVFKRGDDRHIYNMVYTDGATGPALVKRFAIGGISRDKTYDLTKGKPNSKVIYFTSNPNGEAEVIRVKLKPKPKLKKREFDFDFSQLAVKSRSAMGNILTRNPVSRIELSQKGVSTLSAINVFYEESVMRLNNDGRGTLLGAFKSDDKILTVYQNGWYRITGFEVSTHFEDNLKFIRKWNSKLMITAIYYQRKEDKYYLKHFPADSFNKKVDFIPDEPEVKIIDLSIDYLPQILVTYRRKKDTEDNEEIISVTEFTEPMTSRARGKRISFPGIKSVKFIDPLPYEEPEEEIEEEVDDFSTDTIPESVDDAIAKEIFNSDEEQSKAVSDKPAEDEGVQLSIFDE
ncbi:MAG: DNA gyrase/topoisomerase IV subunit A [Bacteroidales bacterium]|nr:DNA gyrase/topoisomerase IV subunit A [Bacteroidales bacterium]